MGTNLSTARDFLDVHERLDEDIRDKEAEVEALSKMAANLAVPGDQEGLDAADKVATLRKDWDRHMDMVDKRVRLALNYVSFHKKAQQVGGLLCLCPHVFILDQSYIVPWIINILLLFHLI